LYRKFKALSRRWRTGAQTWRAWSAKRRAFWLSGVYKQPGETGIRFQGNDVERDQPLFDQGQRAKQRLAHLPGASAAGPSAQASLHKRRNVDFGAAQPGQVQTLLGVILLSQRFSPDVDFRRELARVRSNDLNRNRDETLTLILRQAEYLVSFPLAANGVITFLSMSDLIAAMPTGT
jgi:hypothetical protein